MKQLFRRTLSLFLALLLLLPVCAAQTKKQVTGQPKGYWPYHVAYNKAVEGGNVDEILKKGDALLNFYANYEINTDIAANSYNVYYYRYLNSIFEKRGDYAAAKDNLEKLLYVSEIAGIKDMDTITDAKIRKIDPRTGVFACTADSSAAVYYGAKWEPKAGVYYGRALNAVGGKLMKTEQIANESIASIYLEVGGTTASGFSWLVDQVNNGSRALLFCLNFPKEGTTVSQINGGWHDDNIRKSLAYIAGLGCPVFLRIGAEMNVWTTPTTPEAYKNAYIRIAKLAREVAPNVALVFSVNCVGAYGDDMTQYYPGDEYVDWVGVSLYYNRYMNAKTEAEMDDFGDLYFGIGSWGEPVASVSETVEHWGDRKPIMITEGGVGHYNAAKHTDLSDYAADRITRAYRTLTMVYPQIKGIVYFDTNTDGSDYLYDLDGSQKARAAYDAAVSANETLMHRIDSAAKVYIPLDSFCERASTVAVSAYCYPHYSGDVYTDYYLDGSLYARGDGVTRSVTLDTTGLSVGAHTFTAVFSNGGNFTDTRKFRLTKYDTGVIRFTDFAAAAPALSPSAWAKGEIDAAVSLSVVPDRLLTDFTANITRSDFCTLMMHMLRTRQKTDNAGLLREKGVSINRDAFKDTKSEDVLVANALGILNGRGGGIFDPNSSITREEAATMLTNVANLLGIKTGEVQNFADADRASSWALTPIGFISSVKDKTTGGAVMGGVGGGKFNPKGAYTREQAVLTAVRLFRA